MLNKNLLKSQMALKGYTQKDLAEKCDMKPTTLSYKMNSKTQFNTKEIDGICKALDITDPEMKIQIFLS